MEMAFGSMARQIKHLREKENQVVLYSSISSIQLAKLSFQLFIFLVLIIN